MGARLGWRWRRDWAIRSRLVLVAKYLGLRLTRWVAKSQASVGYVSRGLYRVYDYAGMNTFNWTEGIGRGIVPSIAWADVGVAQSAEHGPVEPAIVGSSPTPHPIVYLFGKHSDGKGWQDYRAAANWTGVPVSFHAIEGATQDAAWRIMATAFAVVVPSRNCDALPRVALEAAYLGGPVIGSDRGGLPEITPAIVSAGDPAALAAEIRRMVEDPAYRQTVAEECQRRARTLFSEAAACEAVEDMYGKA